MLLERKTNSQAGAKHSNHFGMSAILQGCGAALCANGAPSSHSPTWCCAPQQWVLAAGALPMAAPLLLLHAEQAARAQPWSVSLFMKQYFIK